HWRAGQANAGREANAERDVPNPTQEAILNIARSKQTITTIVYIPQSIGMPQNFNGTTSDFNGTS
ncbi:MAG: hypothetical protein KAU38_00255, partial [Desulfobacterales bacterium]|nr:hypothetical protein [Desulfobacterales bacterium]